MLAQRIAPDLWRLPLLGADVLNVYVAGDVLIDAGGRWAHRRLLAALEPYSIRCHVLTHAHLDHQGSSRAVCQHLGVPLLCGNGDRRAVETGNLALVLPRPDGLMARLTRGLAGPAQPVSGVLADGDEVGGFAVVETPGHTPGHLAFWRETDGLLILGDVLFHRNPVTRRLGLAEPFAAATFAPHRNRECARRLAALEPRVVCFGHGPPLRDAGAFRRYVDRLAV